VTNRGRKKAGCGQDRSSLRSAKSLKYQAQRIRSYMGAIVRGSSEAEGRAFESRRARHSNTLPKSLRGVRRRIRTHVGRG
jgi:hypothetical protein